MQKKNNLSQIIQRPRSQNMVRPTKKKINDLKNELTQYLDSNGYLSYSAKKRKYIILGTNSPKDGIVECPQCKIGQLMIIRSPITKKRFIGCSNYNNGCKASSPLLLPYQLALSPHYLNILCSYQVILILSANRPCPWQCCSQETAIGKP